MAKMETEIEAEREGKPQLDQQSKYTIPIQHTANSYSPHPTTEIPK